MDSKICGIIIGGSGLVGGALIYHFHNKCGYCEIQAPNSKKLDLRSVNDIRNYFEKTDADFIVNTAIASLGYDTEGTYNINYLGTINLANVALALKIPYIHMSSSAVMQTGENVAEHQRRKLMAGLGDYTKSKLMCELTLEHLHKNQGLDYTTIRLGIVYGKRDYKIQGFHRLLFAIAAGTMPVLLTKKGVFHSYTNLKKIPGFVEHIVRNRDEFSGKSINFIDSDPVEFSSLILAIRDYMKRKRPYKLYLPLQAARTCIYLVQKIETILAKVGVETTMPPELSFLESLYRTQTLSAEFLRRSSFKDPYTNETIYTNLPDIIEYYLKRWEQLGLLAKGRRSLSGSHKRHADYFALDPEELVKKIHKGMLRPFDTFDDLRNRGEECEGKMGESPGLNN